MIHLPASVRRIGNYAFARCNSLTSVTGTENVTSFGKYAFYQCGALEQIAFTSDIIEVGTYCFTDCTLLGGEIHLSSKQKDAFTLYWPTPITGTKITTVFHDEEG